MIDSMFPETDAYRGAARAKRAPRPWSDREVRRLLRNAGRPHRLAVDPLARALADALGVASPIRAVRAIVDEAFADQGENGRRLRDLIVACDLDRTATQAAIAESMHISNRQFFRTRADAISTVATRIRTLLTPSLETDRPLAALAELVGDGEPDAAVRIYDLIEAAGEKPEAKTAILTTVLAARARELLGERSAARALLANAECRAATLASESPEVTFEIEAMHALRARHDGRAADLKSHAMQLRVHARDDRALILRATILEIEAAIAAGETHAARTLLEFAQRSSYAVRDDRTLGTAVLLRSHLAFLEADYRTAESYATAAGIALRPRPGDAVAAATAVGRARLFLGKRWSLDDRLASAGPASWECAGAGVVSARHLLLAGDVDAAIAAAESALALASEREYHGVWVQAAATLGACAGMSGDALDEQRWYRTALRRFAGQADAGIGHDLFAIPGARGRDLGPIALDDDFLDIICELSERTLAEDRYVPSHRPAAVRAFLRELIAYATESETDGQNFERAAAAVAPDATLRRILRDDRSDLRDALRTLLAVPLHAERREAFGLRIDAFWERCATAGDAA